MRCFNLRTMGEVFEALAASGGECVRVGLVYSNERRPILRFTLPFFASAASVRNVLHRIGTSDASIFLYLHPHVSPLFNHVAPPSFLKVCMLGYFVLTYHAHSRIFQSECRVEKIFQIQPAMSLTSVPTNIRCAVVQPSK
jgi:hypothetical protein